MAFYECETIEFLNLPHLVQMNQDIFLYSGLKAFIAPNLETIGDNIFLCCNLLDIIYTPRINAKSFKCGNCTMYKCPACRHKLIKCMKLGELSYRFVS